MHIITEGLLESLNLEKNKLLSYNLHIEIKVLMPKLILFYLRLAKVLVRS